ncbi:hypothetical protein [Psychroflexus sp. ALD_RP9]|uniref:hypothetical protein n=1 Tax=Psychroflexus sp. ALD_RP9 TaxID=2777186 RepID=UPI001A8D6176|nr:hypothetical protein [Psychroflexus sp. ALD_RP9]QSS98018.1 hypothetical protein IMZ30_04705 [Psychroflexus sp. ALD_RP9]
MGKNLHKYILSDYTKAFVEFDLFEVQTLDLEPRLKQLTKNPLESTLWRFFISSFLYKVGKESELYFTDRDQSHETKAQLKALFSMFVLKTEFFPDIYKDHNRHLYSSVLYKSRILIAYHSEIRKAKQLYDKYPSKCQHYLDALKSWSKKIQIIHFYLEKRYYRHHNSISLQDYVVGKISEGFINIVTLNDKVNKLFYEVDNWNYREQISIQQPNKTSIIKEMAKVFNFEEYKAPIIFIEYPRELAEYKRMLKNWLLKEIEKRKREFHLDQGEMPMAFKIIVEYANRLMNPVEKDYLTKNSPEYLIYPTHIFNSFRAYKLVEVYAKHICSGAQFTFLYRQMRQEVNDYKINVDPAPFEDWFNSTYKPSRRQKVNGTLQKVDNPERKNHYNLTKNLIEELYPVEA